jgi:hypothetical protein
MVPVRWNTCTDYQQTNNQGRDAEDGNRVVLGPPVHYAHSLPRADDNDPGDPVSAVS